jgi:hypothetical protein
MGLRKSLKVATIIRGRQQKLELNTAKMPAMKRKLNEHDVPEASAGEPAPASEEPTFASFGLEPRLVRGVRDQVRDV